jgi:hypothetical protein
MPTRRSRRKPVTHIVLKVKVEPDQGGPNDEKRGKSIVIESDDPSEVIQKAKESLTALRTADS